MMWGRSFFLAALAVALLASVYPLRFNAVWGDAPSEKARLVAEGKAAREFIIATHAAHPVDLDKALESNNTLRADYVRAHLVLAQLSNDAANDDPERNILYDFCRELASRGFGGRCYFKKTSAYDPSAAPTMGHLRERLYRTWKDSLPFTGARASEIAAIGGLSDKERVILEQYGVLVMHNCTLDEEQLSYLDSLLCLIPRSLHDLGAIGVVSFLGKMPPEIGWGEFFAGKGGEINTFGDRIKVKSENPFPDDVPPAETATFCSCAAHEVNHIVDAHTVDRDPVLSARKQALIKAAGRDHKNYLRSMLPDGFFVGAPIEFFASIANQWFTDSAKTVKLGLTRFDNGRSHPINQALFYAEVYSKGGDSTYFYTTNAMGNIARRTVPLQRDARGHINRLIFDDNVYTFTLDDEGNVTSYDVHPCRRR